jgi:uncharacterized protein (TIGR03643 family)
MEFIKDNEDLHCYYSGLPSPLAYAQVEEDDKLDIDRVIEMAWEDRTTFDAIKSQFGLSESDVIELMRKNLKDSSFRRWRKRVQGRATKHLMKRTFLKGNFKCSLQRTITNNKITKKRY